MTNKKYDGQVSSMIIYLRLIESYLIYSILTSPPWGNGEVVLRLEWHKVVVDYVIDPLFYHAVVIPIIIPYKFISRAFTVSTRSVEVKKGSF